NCKAGVFQNVPLSRWSTNSGYDFVMAADVNGDGLNEIVGRSATTGTWWAVAFQAGIWRNIALDNWTPADRFANVATGDVVGYDDSQGMWLASVNGASRTVKLGAWSSAISYQNVQFVDLNGDGKTDIFAVVPGNASFWSIQARNGSFRQQRLASFNADFR